MKTEVLAPAGSKEGLFAALAAGADAVYTGGRMFGARAYADNLSDEELLECIDYCHLHGRRLYLTVNTLFKEEELWQLLRWIEPFYERGLDAAIVQDLGVLSVMKKQFPLLDLHASTQMTIHGAEGAKCLEQMGVTRVVPARELTLEEISRIRRETSLEIECFVHGALCYSYSGQCLMSSLIGGRSGNRGRCAQPCRLPWSYDGGKEQFLLSPKDICTLEILPDILEAGVDSLKIEGRMKRTEYTAGVSAMYRKYVDLYRKKGREKYRVEEEDIRKLQDLYNRGGFSTGYYKRYNGVSMMSVKRQNHYGTKAALLVRQRGVQTVWRALEPLSAGDMLESCELRENVKKGKEFSLRLREKQPLPAGTIWNRTYCAPLMEQLKKDYTGKLLQEKINGKLMIFPGKPAILNVTLGGIRASAEGAVVQKAASQPVSEEKLHSQICKTGNTPYVFEKLEIVTDGNSFLPMQSLNKLRRDALDALKEKQLAKYIRSRAENVSVREPLEKAEKEKESCCFSVSLENPEALEELGKLPGIQRIYLDCKCFEKLSDIEKLSKILSVLQKKGISCWYIMPAIFRDKSRNVYKQAGSGWMRIFDGILVKNLESISFLKEMGYAGRLASDYNLYSFNQEAEKVLRELGISFVTCPAELNFGELEKRGCAGSELILYGNFPVMTSVQCLQKTTGACRQIPGFHRLKDRKGKEFAVRNWCSDCYNVIYNSVPVSLHQMAESVKRLSPASVRLMFTTETKKEILQITKKFLGEYVYGEEGKEAAYAFTRGHYKRGVE